MKPKLVLTAISLLLTVALTVIAVGISTAQQDDHKVYLPILTKPPCEDRRVSAWLMADRPVVRVGETFTVTIAVISEGWR